MKKLLLTLTLFITGVIANQVKAQTSPEFGIRGGINFASFSNSKQEVDSRRVGLLAGAYAVVPISGTSFSIQPEVLYTQKGAEINDVEIKFSYIEIPVLARIDFATERNLTPHLYLGPYAGINVNAEENPPAQGDIPLAEERANDFVYGLTVGGGIDMNSINIGLRYSYGLEEVFKIEGARNTAISIVAGYQF
ncbi:porin family protein [Fodinibius salsisoli]|uniref:PorT family protein n=1 Tax=Fodinibius salsisoli TaxID=2820877 RepID=A0ABT3PHQ5_9BACT|nr:porin family protein [Fodinibius salsisoli]MCW9705437.1 PorT family protein [Fodinibius salsisoli]